MTYCVVFMLGGDYMLNAMCDDQELLQQYVKEGQQAAFTELVQRKMDFVYSAALRQVNGDAHLAHDVVQRVFFLLAQQSAGLVKHPSLTGWLYTTTRFVAMKMVRTDQRWRARGANAEFMERIEARSSSEPSWHELRPLIDDAMNELKAHDREALLLRFFEGHSFSGVGAKIGLGENSARMRVERAVERLRQVLHKRGIPSTAAALGLVLSQNAVAAAPAGIATAVAANALMGVTLTGGSASLGIFSIMNLPKIQLGIIAGLGLLSAGGLALQRHDRQKLLAENQRLQAQVQSMSARPTEKPKPEAVPSESDELLRLRSENAALRQEKARTAKQSTGAAAVVSYMSSRATDPLTQDFFAQLKGREITTRYAGIFKQLDLSDEKREQLKKLLLDKQMLGMDVLASAKAQGVSGLALQNAVSQLLPKGQAESDKAIQDLLGAQDYQEFKKAETLVPHQAMVDQLSEQLSNSSSPLTQRQNDQLVQALAANGEKPSRKGSINGVALVTDESVGEAKKILSPEQVDALLQIKAQQEAILGQAKRQTSLSDGSGATVITPKMVLPKAE